MKMFDLSSQSVTITPGMHFSYWILPQSPKNTGLVSGSNSAFVALDLIFTDGTELRDSALTDQHSVSVNPQYQGSILVLATWNYVTVDMTPLAGKTVNRVDLGYNQPGGTGGYRGYVDDIAFTTPATAAANIALNRPASGDSQQGGNLAGNGNDGNNGTRWSANYIFKRSAGSGGEVSIGSTTNTVYADTGLTNGTTYYYVVAAQNLLGQSGNSAEVAATPQPPVPGSYAATLVADHPLAYWPLNETNGTAAYDLVGGHNGTYVGGVTLGQPGVPLAGFITPDYAALFNGTSGYVDIPEGPFNITGVITMVAWINVPVAPGFSDIIGHGDGSWCMSVDASGQPGGSDGNVGDATGSASIVGAGWKMVAFTYTGVNTGNNGSLYVNGTLVAQNTVSTTPAGNAYDVWIGSAPDYVGRGLPGSIAHAAVFNTALSPTQVRALNNASLVASPVTLKIAPAGSGGLTFNWLEGTLLQATNVAGPWTTNPAASPYTTAPTNAQMYFKVRVN